MKNAIWTACLCVASLFAAGCEDDFATVLNLRDDEPAVPVDPTPDDPDVGASAIKLGSYNLWISTKGTGDYLWTNRRPILAQSIADNAFDIFGFQEADETIKNELPVLVAQAGGNYEWWFFGRDNLSGSVGEACGIAWNPDRFELSDRRGFWLSETPDEVSYGWDETGYHRIAIAATVKDLTTKKKFLLMVTHGPLSANARAKAAELLVEREQAYNAEGLPSILVGDMNAAPDDAASVTLRGHWSDARTAAPVANVYGPVGTFQSHKTTTDLSDESRRIDYIYVRGEAEVLSFRTDNSIIGGIYPSDHCPVSIQMNITYTPDEIEGSGTEADPFRLDSARDWNAIAASINAAGESYPAGACYRLAADLDFTGKTFTAWNEFEGTLDGAGFTMKGIAAANADEKEFGPICTNRGVVKNLAVEAAFSSVYRDFGGVVGINKGTIDGVTFRGTLTGTAASSYIGGIAGQNTETGVVVNCANLGGEIDAKTATKAENCGGIVGGLTKGAYIVNCYSLIDRIASSNNNIAGIVGFVGNDSFVVNSYSTLASIDAGGTYCSAVAYSKIGNLQNIYGNADCTTSKAGALVANDKKAGTVWKTTTGALLTLDQMKSGAVTVASSGESCADFAAALNAGAAIFDATTTETLASKPAVTLRRWKMAGYGPAFE